MANPTCYNENGKRIAIKGAKNRIGWFVGILEKNGCHVENTYEKTYENVEFQKNNMKVTFGKSEFEGRIQITDSDKFIQMLEKGIGREKAYGCGMLMFG